MTKKELRQIYYINGEIRMWQTALDRLRCKSLVKSPIMSDMPRGGKSIDLADIATDAADYEQAIQGLLAQAQIQCRQIMEYIDSIDDNLMRQIIYLRNVCLMSWEQVANSIGGGNTENSIRMIYNRFFEER